MNNYNEYPQGIWCIDKERPNMAIKTTEDKKISVPLTKELLNEIKRQIEAEKLFRAFNNIHIEDTNIIGYLDLILNDYVNFLSIDSKNILINKMTEIEKSSQLDKQNVYHLKNLEIQLRENNIEDFYDTLDEFHNYNISVFENNLSNEGTHGKSH